MDANTRKGPEFGDPLRCYRTAADLTQEGLAAGAGLTSQAVSALERGIRRHPQRETVRLLAEALGLSDLGIARHSPLPPADG